MPSRHPDCTLRSCSCRGIIGALTAIAFSQATGAPSFEEVTESAGLSRVGFSHGAAWGDANTDGRPDLWAGNHAEAPSLYINNGDGTFSNIGDTIAAPLFADLHGAAWADFDNDGDEDLVVAAGGGAANLLYVNGVESFDNHALALGVEYRLGRGRTPLWFDWNRDGVLDLFLANWQRSDGQTPSSVFTQRNGTFVDEGALLGVAPTTNNSFAQVAHLSIGAAPVLVVHGIWPHYPDGVYDYSDAFSDVSAAVALPPTTEVWDAAFADFDGDQRTDVYLTRLRNPSEAVQTHPNRVAATVVVDNDEKGIEFAASGEIEFRIEPWPVIVPDDIYIGAQGYRPPGRVFVLAEADPANHGVFDHEPGVDLGAYVYFDPAAGLWHIDVSSPERDDVYVIAEADDTISNLRTIGFDSSDGALADSLLLQVEGGFVDGTVAAGLDGDSACEAALAADLDNDMDIDLYLVCRGPVTNLPNRLFENTGSGTFQAVADAGGAAGAADGRGDTVAAADFDGDGFLDLFVTNGRGVEPFGIGPDQLYRNAGNDNRWLELDLEGVVSNRDGVGASVEIMAGGLAQHRFLSGGMHRFTQNHKRLHVGLGGNDTVDRLVVRWPSGIEQVVDDLPANQLVRILETSTPDPVGRPRYVGGVSTGAFLWKDSVDGPYRLRASLGDLSEEFRIVLLSTHALADARSSEGAQSAGALREPLTVFENGFVLAARGNGDEYGVDFTLAPGAGALLAVEFDGHANPRQLKVGHLAGRLTPAGWIGTLSELPSRPDYEAGTDLGLFVGRSASANEFEAHASGDGTRHTISLTVLSSAAIDSVSPLGLEAVDELTQGEFFVELNATVSSGSDGIGISLPQDAQTGIVFLQDRLFQRHRVNPDLGALGEPNAYWLPAVAPVGEQVFEQTRDSGVARPSSSHRERWDTPGERRH